MKLNYYAIVFLFIVNISLTGIKPKIGIIGCGYVGLTMASVMREGSYSVSCFDIDSKKIESLKNGIMPIYEPGLHESLFSQYSENNIAFYDKFNNIIDCDIFYICTPTPTNELGGCDVSYVFDAFDMLLKELPTAENKIVVVKSTVPPQTVRRLANTIPPHRKNISVVYNPEFLREGSALADIHTTNPIILGSDSNEAIDQMVSLYDFLLKNGLRVIKTNYESAEIIKYSWNSFSAIRIAYINDLAYLCRELGADIFTVIEGMSLSELLLPTHVIRPGPGYGGSCLPKDTRSFSRTLEMAGLKSSLTHQAIKSNHNHVERIITDIFSLLGDEADFNNKIVSLLGLSFKANTNDIRFSPAIRIIQALIEKGVHVRAYDPKAIEDMKNIHPHIQYCYNIYDAIKESDCIVSLTEWDIIKDIDFEYASRLCRNKTIYDTRNLYDKSTLTLYGFKYLNMGKNK